MDQDVKLVIGIVAFIAVIFISLCLVTSFGNYCTAKVSIEAIKAGLHQDQNGQWVK